MELATKEEADRAISEINGKDCLGRSIKVGLGVARSRNERPQPEPDRLSHLLRDNTRPAFDRWVRSDAPEHWKGYSEQGRRLFIGGLPHMPDHDTVDVGVRKLFSGYTVCVLPSVLVVPLAH